MKAEAMKRTAGVFADILAESGDELSVPLSRDEARTVAEILRAVAGGRSVDIYIGDDGVTHYRDGTDTPELECTRTVLVIGGGA